ncbi:MAG: hypothetical protein ACOYO1_12690 [Bacteroidales bacterium]
MKFKIILFFAFILHNLAIGQDIVKSKPFIFFPGAYQKWEYKISTGLSLTRLPNEIIEEEINTLPTINADFKMGLPLKFILHSRINTNYISNMLSLAFQKSIIDKKIAMAVGVNTSYWFGQLYQDVIRLKAYGFIANPYITGGIHFKDIYLSLKLENQFSIMKTASEDEMLGRSLQPNSAYAIQFTIEQALWKNNWVALGVKLNYSKFYYQAWLTYTAIDEYLLYPEYSFTFIF